MHIRDRILRGAVFLSARQVLGVVVRGGGALLLLRLLGPVEYGLYAGSAAIVVFLALVAPLGVDVYLLQREEEPSEQIQDQAFSFLLVSSLAAVAVGLLLSIGVVRALPDPGFTAPFRALLLAVPLEVLWVLARARMERSLRFGRLAALELGADVVFYIVSLGLALRGFGVWAPVAGYVVRQTCQLIAGYVVAGCRPRWDWSPSALREPLRYGIGYSSSRWITESSGLINPLLVGGLLGPAAVGYVAVATSLVDALGFVKTATTRLGIAAFARIQNETERLRNAHREGTVLQVLGHRPTPGRCCAARTSCGAPSAHHHLGACGRGVRTLRPWRSHWLAIQATFLGPPRLRSEYGSPESPDRATGPSPRGRAGPDPPGLACSAMALPCS